MVDDDEVSRSILLNYFTKQGFDVLEASTGATCRRIAYHQKPDLILLDINLPDGDGLTLARDLQRHCAAGIIFVTVRGESADRVVGLELGGDDYVVKPVDLRELLARVRSVLRRRARQLQNSPDGDVRRFSAWTIDLVLRQLFDRAGNLVPLSRGEFDLLAALIMADGRAVDRAHLSDLISGRNEPGQRSVDTLVYRLRRRLETDARAPTIVQTVHSLGYRLGVPVSR